MASRTFATVVAVALVVLTGAVPAAQQVETRIAPNDQLRVAVTGADMLGGTFTVDSTGEFDLPHVGRLKAGGLTVRELSELISQTVVDMKLMTRAPQVVVDLTQSENQQVTVTGAVRSQGYVKFAGTLTLFDALLRSGMTGPDAADEVLVVRTAADGSGEEQVMTVNLRQLTGGNIAQFDIPLQDGDRIIVPEAEKVFIDGYVRSPGAYTVPPDTTLRQALTYAGGITDRGSDRGIKILRRAEGDDEPKELKNVDLDAIVLAGDTIIIRKRIL
jgi:polysaccharide export outer membrane protein